MFARYVVETRFIIFLRMGLRRIHQTFNNVESEMERIKLPSSLIQENKSNHRQSSGIPIKSFFTFLQDIELSCVARPISRLNYQFADNFPMFNTQSSKLR